MRDPIPLKPDEGAPPPPSLPGTVVVREDVESVTESLATELLIHAHNCVRTFGDFHLALPGGRTPVPLYRRLMIDPKFRDLPWKRTHLWLVDEHPVPFDDERSNFKTINEFLGDHSDIPREQLHPIYALADDAADRYETELREVLLWREKGQDRLDYVLLGLGADGSVAGLTATENGHDDRLVRHTPSRTTMTRHLINASRFVAILVTGNHKADVIRAITEPDASSEALPVLAISPVGGTLRWYLDAAACPTSPSHSRD
jgi:6-phosphogluconolactonase